MDQPQLPDAEGDIGQTIQEVVRVFKEGRWWILLTGLTAVALTVCALSFVPNLYKSEATILIVEQQIPQSLVAPLSTATVGQRLDAMKQEVLSRAPLLQIIDENGLFAKQRSASPDVAVELMRRAIDIEPIDLVHDSFSAFSISFSSTTPEKAQEVTKRLSSLFIERSSEANAHKATTTTSFLNAQLEGKRKRAAQLEQGIEAFKLHNLGELPDERPANQTRLEQVRTQLQTTVASLSRARGQRIIWESMLSGNVNAALTRLKSERKALLVRFTPQHPDVVKKDEEIGQMEALLSRITTGTSVVDKQLERLAASDPMVAQLEGQLDANQAEIEDLAKDEKRLQAAIDEAQRHLNLMPAREQQLAGLTRELDALNEEIKGVAKMQQPSELAADMEKRQEGQRFRQLDPASLPSKPWTPDRLRISLGAMAGGLVLGFALAFLKDRWNPTFHTEKELRQRFSPPFVIAVPLLATPAETRKRGWTAGLEWVGGSAVTAAMLAIEFYVYKHR